MTYKCSGCREKFKVLRESEEVTCPTCGNVIPVVKVSPKLPPPRPIPAEIVPSPWGCTDRVPPPPFKEKIKEPRPDILPEYLTPAQARDWGISIRELTMHKEL